MKTCGIIAEFNPFHTGHAALLTAAREEHHADYILLVLSGDYVQRGEPALVDKYARTQMALENGADVVLELPTAFATGSAQYFARGAVAALCATGVTDLLLFGTEDPSHIAFTPASLENASVTHVRNMPFERRPAPNDLLAREYLHAMSYFHAPFPAAALQRQGASYHEMKPRNGYASAAFLRRLLLGQKNGEVSNFTHDGNITVLCNNAAQKNTEIGNFTCEDNINILCENTAPKNAETKKFTRESDINIVCNNAMPKNVAISDFMRDGDITILCNYQKKRRLISTDDFSPLCFYTLLRERSVGYSHIFDISADLSDKIQRSLENYTTFNGFLHKLKSKDLTYTHLSRALLHILLDIRTEDTDRLMNSYGYCPWLRLLGFRKSASPLLHRMKQTATRPIISRPADAKNLLTPDAFALWEKDIAAADLYEKTACADTAYTSEYRRRLVIL